MPRFARALPVLGLLWSLSGCILVEDFGAVWKTSAPDTCLTKMAESIYVGEFRRDPSKVNLEQVAHGWTLEGNHYLLLKQNPEDKGGRLYRFRVENGIFQRFRLDPAMRERFLKDYPNAPVTLGDNTATLATLNADTEKLLTEIANDPSYWEMEDQAMYNILRDETCRFEDRDLAKMKAEEEGKQK